MPDDLIDRLLNEAPIDTGEYPDFIDPDRKRKFAKREHPLAKNPAYPEYKQEPGSKNRNYEEMLASGQYKATVQRLNQYMTRILGNEFRISNPGHIGQIMWMGMESLQACVQIEQAHRPQLEKLAVDLAMDLPEFRRFRKGLAAGEFKIVAKLGKPDLQRAQMGAPAEEEPEEQEGQEGQEGHDDQEGQEGEQGEQGGFESPESQDYEMAILAAEKEELNLEIKKRQFINAMIQGSAIGKNYAFHMVQQQLDAIDPKLCNLYGFLMAMGEFSYFIVPEEMQRMAISAEQNGMDGGAGGSEEVEWEDDTPVIRAYGVTFPVLVQEVVKGLMELASMHGLPKDQEVAKKVKKHADLMDHEVWSIICGRGLWTQFLQQIHSTDDELTMYLYTELTKLAPSQFNNAMRVLLAGGKPAQDLTKKLFAKIRQDLENQEGDHGTNESISKFTNLLG